MAPTEPPNAPRGNSAWHKIGGTRSLLRRPGSRTNRVDGHADENPWRSIGACKPVSLSLRLVAGQGGPGERGGRDESWNGEHEPLPGRNRRRTSAAAHSAVYSGKLQPFCGRHVRRGAISPSRRLQAD